MPLNVQWQISPCTGQASQGDIIQWAKRAVVYIEVDSYVRVSMGSGFIVSPDGFILTNAHVVRGGVGANVVVNSGTPSARRFRAEVVRTGVPSGDKEDIALLKIATTGLSALTLSDALPREGDDVTAFGFPLGTELQTNSNGPNISVRKGSVTSLRTDNAGRLVVVEHSCQTEQGNSGGPLLDRYGRVVGINVSGIATFIGGQVVSESSTKFAIPAYWAQQFLAVVRDEQAKAEKRAAELREAQERVRIRKEKEAAEARQRLENQAAAARQALAVDRTNADAWLALSDALEQLGDGARAMGELNAGMQSCPRSIRLYLRMADKLKKQGRKEDAVAVLKKGFEIEPHNQELSKALWDNGIDLASPTVSLGVLTTQALRDVVSIDMRAQDNVSVSVIKLWVDADLLETVTTDHVVFQWDSSQVADGKHTIKVAAYDRAGNKMETQETVEVLNYPHDKPEPYVAEAKEAMESGDIAKSARYLMKARRVAPTDNEILRRLANAERQLGHQGIASTYYAELCKQLPKDIEAARALAEVGGGFALHCDYVKLVESVGPRATIAPENTPAAYLNRARSSISDGKLDDAENYAKSALEGAPRSSHPHLMLGQIYLLKRMDEWASFHADRAVKLAIWNDRYTNVLAGLIWAYIGNMEQVQKYVLKSPVSDRSPAWAWASRGWVLSTMGDHINAESCLARAKRMDAEHFKFIRLPQDLNLGTLNGKLGELFTTVVQLGEPSFTDPLQ